ncbi:MAG TPA: CBS domain-containing protein [Steroidobacteraceae bacterium]|nr:CBS domain-containing protein [Steroidobacteraceae bacterium]
MLGLLHNPITLTAQATVSDAIGLFLQHSVSCIPIVNEAFKPVGIVSSRDVLRTFAARGIAP